MTTEAPDTLLPLLRQDHERVQTALHQTAETRAELKKPDFWRLTDLLVRHEVAEAIVVFPVLRKLRDAQSITTARIAEQARADADLAHMESLDPRSAQFAHYLEGLTSAIGEHAHNEEVEAFPLLEKDLSERKLRWMGERYVMIRAVAPTHPHPHSPDTPPGNVILGPVAALVDRIRDTGRSLYMGFGE